MKLKSYNISYDFFFQLNKQQFLKIAKTYWVLLDICSFLTRMVNSFQLLNNK